MNTRKSHICTLFILALLLVSDILSAQGVMAQCTTDSTFLIHSRPVIFRANTTDIRPEDAQWITDSLIPQLQKLGPNSILLGRSAASPEGPLLNNRRLAAGRYQAIHDFLKLRGFDPLRIQFDVADEDYPLLVEMMRFRHDADYDKVRRIVTQHGDDFGVIKKELMDYSDGILWTRLLKDYFPLLRAVRIMAYDQNRFRVKSLDVEPFDVRIAQVPHHDPVLLKPETGLSRHLQTLYRRELLSVKTNLLEWGAYVPQYGWCPMPNVAFEYYPRHGHWTFGASIDFPWWVGNTSNHKYFELNNYQLEARYYFRNSDLSYSDPAHTQPSGVPAFKGWYLQGNVHGFLYQIGFNAKKGWIGEGFGGGIGAGYVLPLSKGGHWRLDFGLQVGYFWTQYDPFIYGIPEPHGGGYDGDYYYDTDRYKDNFVKRQHRFSWFGPTRIGITLSYDLLYRRKHSKRPGFSKWEKGDALW